jgi:hypothetical protein
MTTTQLDNEKRELLKKVSVLTNKKKELYSNMDIETPMSNEEKNLNNEIANIFSRINAIVKEKTNLNSK